MIDDYPLIPKEAFLFFPKEEEVYQIRNRKVFRIIFQGNVPYTPFEKEKIRQLHQEIKKQTKYSHLSFFPQCTILRFLQATKFDIEDCLKELKKYKKWQESILPLRLRPEIEDILKKGLFYMVGRDINFRPIIVVNVARIIDLDLKQKIFYEAIGFFFTFILENCMIQGQIETWITIVDLGKIGMFSLGGTIIDIISFLSRNFRCRLHYSYLINCPGSIRFLFGMAKKAMTQDQINKIHLQEQAQLPPQAFTNIFQQDIEKKYGGKHEDYSTFWPPLSQPSNSSSYQKSRLISVREYGEMYERGLLKKKKISASLLQECHKLQKEEYDKKLMDMNRQAPKQAILQTQEEQGNPQTNTLKDEDYVEDLPPSYPEIPKPIDSSTLFD